MLTRRSSLGQIGVGERQLVADAQNRLVQAQAGLDADHHQVEGVGQAELDLVLALLGHPGQDDAGQHVAEQRPAKPNGHVRPDNQRRRKEHEGAQGHRHAQADKQRQRLGAAEARLDQAQADLADLRRATPAPSSRRA